MILVFVVTNWHGKIICKRYVIKRVELLKKKGYPAFKPHDLRHTHCTKLIDSGINMQYVQQRLGHKSLKVTLDIYTHLTAARRKTEASKLDSAFSAMTSF
ncbi:tyrosine-type recombinase/integrase [Ruminococcus sp. HUN007]|uniref:tyrosine-type recombinase/integrase n=1 Tax=Ruminococcus sp. HUN007 TaxID=1514668 RepID=UPI0005D13BBC|nr:tyrosine-type recombinase/integrase [Ruminococcus sp. HUN007]